MPWLEGEFYTVENRVHHAHKTIRTLGLFPLSVTLPMSFTNTSMPAMRRANNARRSEVVSKFADDVVACGGLGLGHSLATGPTVAAKAMTFRGLIESLVGISRKKLETADRSLRKHEDLFANRIAHDRS
jgi:hypothetical protein